MSESDIRERVAALEANLRSIRHDLGRLFSVCEKHVDALARIETMLDCEPPPNNKVDASLSDHNNRLTSLELARAKQIGERTVIGMACTLIGLGIGWLVTWFHK